VTEPKPIAVDRLEPGDVLLSLGASKTSAAIRALDGGSYSHAALWTGEGIIESTTPEVIQHSLDQSLELHPRVYVDAFRHKTIGSRGAAVVTEARRYAGRPYAYGDLFISALLMSTTAWRPTSGWQLAVLTSGCQLNHFLKLDKPREGELVTCTELAVRSYFQAHVPIHVVPEGGDRFDGKAMLAAIVELAGGAIPKDAGPPVTPEQWTQTQELLRTKFFALTGRDPLIGDGRKGAVLGGWDGHSPVAAGADWGANLVTPHYLEKSPDLELQGRLHFAPGGAKMLRHSGTPARRSPST
jgi:hypothetical protein